ncbi:MAG: hypothetical protein HQL30_12080 [Candidatus Omnitrophica bacterium]|nr:hypothetical protein [Candidatus Omnitrophota bacterium]
MGSLLLMVSTCGYIGENVNAAFCRSHILLVKILLLLLLLSIIKAFYLSPSLYSDNRFFRDDISFFEDRSGTDISENRGNGCDDCDGGDVNTLLAGAQKGKIPIGKGVPMGKLLKDKYKERMGTDNGYIYLFLRPDGAYNNEAIMNLVDFKEKNSLWDVKVLVLCTFQEFRDFTRKHTKYFSYGIPFSMDLNNLISDKYGIQYTPSYVICRGEKNYRIAGQPDLNNVIKRL